MAPLDVAMYFMETMGFEEVYDSLRSTILVRHAYVEGISRPPSARLVASVLVRS